MSNEAFKAFNITFCAALVSAWLGWDGTSKVLIALMVSIPLIEIADRLKGGRR